MIITKPEERPALVAKIRELDKDTWADWWNEIEDHIPLSCWPCKTNRAGHCACPAHPHDIEDNDDICEYFLMSLTAICRTQERLRSEGVELRYS